MLYRPLQSRQRRFPAEDGKNIEDARTVGAADDRHPHRRRQFAELETGFILHRGEDLGDAVVTPFRCVLQLLADILQQRLLLGN